MVILILDIAGATDSRSNCQLYPSIILPGAGAKRSTFRDPPWWTTKESTTFNLHAYKKEPYLSP